MSQMKLQSSDGKIFEVDMEIAKCSALIKVILEDLGLVEEDGKGFLVPNVKSEVLEKIIKWATYHKNDPISPQLDDSEDIKRDICKWDAEFLKANQDCLMDLMVAANYLDIKNLFDLTYGVLVKSMKTKTKEKIREMFNIKKKMRKMRSKLNCVII